MAVRTITIIVIIVITMTLTIIENNNCKNDNKLTVIPTIILTLTIRIKSSNKVIITFSSNNIFAMNKLLQKYGYVLFL